MTRSRHWGSLSTELSSAFLRGSAGRQGGAGSARLMTCCLVRSLSTGRSGGGSGTGALELLEGGVGLGAGQKCHGTRNNWRRHGRAAQNGVRAVAAIAWHAGSSAGRRRWAGGRESGGHMHTHTLQADRPPGRCGRLTGGQDVEPRGRQVHRVLAKAAPARALVAGPAARHCYDVGQVIPAGRQTERAGEEGLGPGRRAAQGGWQQCGAGWMRTRGGRQRRLGAHEAGRGR